MIGIYCRVSRDEGNEPNRSIRNQKDFGIQLAKKEGMPYQVYSDENVSGAGKLENRPQFSIMLDDIVAGKIKAVFATEQDRLERNPQMRFMFLETLKNHGVDLYLSGEIQDLGNLEDEFLGGIKSLMNNYYVKITSKKIKNVLKNNASKGIVHGIMPYGYCRDKNKIMIIDEEEKIIVEQIYAMSLRGIGTIKIAQILTDKGVLTRYNKMKHGGTISIKNKYTKKITKKNKSDIKWSGKTIQDIIKNKVYIGIRTFSGEKYECPAIFEEWYWKKVNDNLKKNRNNSGKSVAHKYMLKGVIECGGCGRNMYGRTRTNKKDNFYTCSGKRYKYLDCGTRSINIDALEDFVWSMFFVDGELLKMLTEYFDRDSKLFDEIDTKINEQLSRIRGLQNEKDKAIQMVMKGVLSESDVINEVNRVNNITEDAQNIVSKLKEQKITIYNSNDLLVDLEILSNTFTSPPVVKNHIRHKLPSPFYKPEISFEDKSTIIKKYIKRIKITSDDKLKLYNIAISFTIDVEPQNFVMNYFKRVPYINSLESIQVLHKSKAWRGRYREDLYKLDNHEATLQLTDDTQVISDSTKSK